MPKRLRAVEPPASGASVVTRASIVVVKNIMSGVTSSVVGTNVVGASVVSNGVVRSVDRIVVVGGCGVVVTNGTVDVVMVDSHGSGIRLDDMMRVE